MIMISDRSCTALDPTWKLYGMLAALLVHLHIIWDLERYQPQLSLGELDQALIANTLGSAQGACKGWLGLQEAVVPSAADWAAAGATWPWTRHFRCHLLSADNVTSFTASSSPLSTSKHLGLFPSRAHSSIMQSRYQAGALLALMAMTVSYGTARYMPSITAQGLSHVSAGRLEGHRREIVAVQLPCILLGCP